MIQKVLGVTQGILFESAASLSEDDGEPLLERFAIEADDVAVDLAKRFEDASIGIAFVGELLVSDYGKLQAVRRSGLLGISATGYGETIKKINKGSKLWSYQSLMPTAYEAISHEEGGADTPLPRSAREFACVERSGRGTRAETPRLPGEGLLKPLVEPGEMGIGYFAPWFWSQAFGYPGKKVRSVGC